LDGLKEKVSFESAVKEKRSDMHSESDENDDDDDDDDEWCIR